MPNRSFPALAGRSRLDLRLIFRPRPLACRLGIADDPVVSGNLRSSPITCQETAHENAAFSAHSLLLSVSALPGLAAEPLPRSSPESQGVSSAAILEFIEAADKNIESMNSFMLVGHGKVVAEGWWWSSPESVSS